MANIKSLDRISSKWTRVASASGASYADGIDNPRADWAQQTAAAEQNYEAGVQAAISRKAFGSGVKKAGTAKWQDRARTLGPARYSQGVQQAENAYADGFAPYRSVIANLSLPARGPKGDPNNIQRVAKIATALHAEKLKRAKG